MLRARRPSVLPLLSLILASLAWPAARAETPIPSGRTEAEVLAGVQKYVTDSWKPAQIPGLAYAVVRDDRVVLAQALGRRKVDDPAPVTTSTLFEIGSTSKAFTAALLGAAVDSGKIGWDTRVLDVLPGFRMHDPWATRELRMTDLVSQRSGMPAYSLDMMSFLGFDRTDIQEAVVHVEPVSSFRNGYAYQNNLWLVAASVVEKVTGRRWEDALDRTFFGPLGMLETTADPEVVAIAGDVATGHLRQAGGALTPIGPDWPYRSWIDVYGPAGGIRSTVLDFTRWARLHLARGTFGGQTILQPATVDTLHAPRTFAFVKDGVSYAYTFGWIAEQRWNGLIVWHNGGTSGQHSIIALYPAASTAVMVLTNSPDNSLPEGLKDALFDLLFVPAAHAVQERPAPVRALLPLPLPGVGTARSLVAPLAPLPPLPAERYVGTYQNPAYGRIEVKQKGTGLVAVMGPAKVEGVLVHSTGNTFVLSWPQYAGADAMLTFVVPSGKPAETFVADIFADVNGGAFLRVGR